MKTFWAILGLVILVSGIAALIGFSGSKGKVAGYATDDPAAPKLVVEEKKFDFGKITLQDKAIHDYKLKNTGKNPLVIANVMTSCHCTSAIFKMAGQPDSPEFGMHVDSSWKGEIPAGGEAIIEAIYTPALMPVSGQISRVISFSTNDPVNKEVQLELTGIVQ